jgi:UDP-2,4-diacetamido-2,4,6-trideoxy-beta-L-altropyranose hydrolase
VLAGTCFVKAMPLALFRCDASPGIGAGHVSRCLTLAEAFADAGWRIGFVVARETVPTVPAIADSGHAVRVLDGDDQDVAVLREQAANGADLLVADHYGRDAGFETACRPFVRNILVFDDMTGRDHDCDILVDAAAPSPQPYIDHVPARARVLNGVSFALTRKSFLAARPRALARRDGRAVERILVTCGATDPANATAIVLDTLADAAPDIPVTVVLSSQAAHIDALRKRLRGNVRLVLDADDMAALMTDADLAIGAPGATAYERAVLGLPSIMITLADNQRGVAQAITRAGAAIDAGMCDQGLAPRLRQLVTSLLADGPARKNLAQASSRLIDGRGALRIMLECLGAAPAKDGGRVRLRLAEPDDENWLLDLQRQPDTRRHFRNPAIPSAEEHHQWMERILADESRLLLIVEVDGARSGMVRLDRLADRDGRARYEVSIAVDRNCGKRGVGSAALALTRRLLPAAVFEAEIMVENAASQSVFARAGFNPVGDNRYRNEPS